MRKFALVTLGGMLALATLGSIEAFAQSAAYFAQLEKDKVNCDKAGNVWDGRRCQPKGFFSAANLQCKEGYKPVKGKCRKDSSPWNNPNCSAWQVSCNAGKKSACGKYESKCQVN